MMKMNYTKIKLLVVGGRWCNESAGLTQHVHFYIQRKNIFKWRDTARTRNWNKPNNVGYHGYHISKVTRDKNSMQ